MPRVKRGTIANKRRKKLLKEAKGFKWGRKSKYRLAKEALMHAWSYQYRDRRNKKRDRRRLWQVQINAALMKYNISYSKFMGQLKKKEIQIDRKILSQLANEKPEIFEEIVKQAKTKS